MPYPCHYAPADGDMPIIRVNDAGVSVVAAVRRTSPTDGPTHFLHPYGPPTAPASMTCRVRLSTGDPCGRPMVGLGDGVHRCRHHLDQWRDRHEAYVLALRATTEGGTNGNA